eukprot:CAMPEP_0173159532 /NCGR_PEP_ID=MMETSP1105-20130129/17187_1 /TAXON_ID=2985 /ORGANISM="Ochromonas sp., Strain BG-1" /LENGTH=56 /DNA_ID=CAMNT_0014078027 /DNA_START=793 /DNA_END=963 /DNA_ORIENTATION=+
MSGTTIRALGALTSIANEVAETFAATSDAIAGALIRALGEIMSEAIHSRRICPGNS